MPGPNSRQRSSPRRGRNAHELRRWAIGPGCALVLSASQSSCSFPDYTFGFGLGVAGAAGSAASSAGGVAGESGTVSAGSTNGGASTNPSGGASADSGAAGADDSDGCVYPSPVTYPGHCFDSSSGDGETGVDCGGADCAACSGADACLSNRDCASGVCGGGNICAQILSMQSTSYDSSADTRAPKFAVTFKYLASDLPTLDRFKIRYYFNHNGVTEPVIAQDVGARLNANDISGKVSGKVHRFPLGPRDHNQHQTDSYLEIWFSAQSVLSAGTTVTVTADVVAGSPDLPFNQTINYSFTAGGPAPNQAITIYRANDFGSDQRVWGIEPPLTLIPDCSFADGVNLAGGAVKVDQHQLSAAGDQLTFTGTPYDTNQSAPYPDTDPATSKVLNSGFPFTGSERATWRVQPGSYWAYAWLSSNGTNSGTLTIQDEPADKFYGLQKSAGAGWALIGPYAIKVGADGIVELGAVGFVNLAGLELFNRP